MAHFAQGVTFHSVASTRAASVQVSCQKLFSSMLCKVLKRMHLPTSVLSPAGSIATKSGVKHIASLTAIIDPGLVCPLLLAVISVVSLTQQTAGAVFRHPLNND